MDLVGIDIGEFEGHPAAAVEVDHREHGGRAGRVGQPVHGEAGDGAGGVGHGSRLHVVGCAALLRHPGRGKVHHLAGPVPGAGEPVLPVGAAVGGRRRRSGRGGPVRGLDRHYVAPSQEAAVGEGSALPDLSRNRCGRTVVSYGLGDPQDDRLHAVGQRHDRDGLARASMLQSRGQQQRGVSGGCVAHRGDQRIDEAARLGAHGLERRGHGPAVETGDGKAINVGGGVQPAVIQRGLPGLQRSRAQHMGAEALLPGAGAVPTWCAPAFCDLQRAAGAPEVLGQHRPIGVVTNQQRGGAVAGGGLVGAGGQAVSGVGGDHQRPAAPSQSSAQRADPGADRTPEVES